MPDSLNVDGLLANGWVYRDIPQMTYAYWRWFLDTLGADNYHLLSEAKYWDGEQRGDPDAARGQLIISPAGLANLTRAIGSVPDLSPAPKDPTHAR